MHLINTDTSNLIKGTLTFKSSVRVRTRKNHDNISPLKIQDALKISCKFSRVVRSDQNKHIGPNHNKLMKYPLHNKTFQS